MADALIDNDVRYKTAMYGLLSHLVEARPFDVTVYGMLGAAKFMISKKLSKRPPARGSASALQEFADAIVDIAVVEPTPDELIMAGQLEYAAKQLNLELDGGESILCAVLLSRKTNYIFTGDKRAVRAIAGLMSADENLQLAKKIVCLEQIFKHLIQGENAHAIRTAVCTEPKTDTALANVFSCFASEINPASWDDGLRSYINALNEAAPNTLLRTD